MAKRKRKETCKTDNCLVHKFFPMVDKKLGENSCFYIDEISGEVFIATGMRVLPDLEVVDMGDEVNHWVDVRCSCGNEGAMRVDLLQTGKIRSCPNCAANKAFGERN
jgi:hypothetical protein